MHFMYGTLFSVSSAVSVIAYIIIIIIIIIITRFISHVAVTVWFMTS